MRINTKYLGEMEIDEKKIIHFPVGIPGFMDERAFILLDLPENPVFQIMQSTTTVNTAFIITNPYHFYKQYSFELDEHLLETLEIKSETDVAVMSIVTLKEPFSKSTLNLKAPIIINSKRKLGKQYILNIDEYSTKAPISLTNKTEMVKGE